MSAYDSTSLGSMLRDALEDQDTDTLWWIVDELLGKHENTTKVD